jgi:hypothetical protein
VKKEVSCFIFLRSDLPLLQHTPDIFLKTVQNSYRRRPNELHTTSGYIVVHVLEDLRYSSIEGCFYPKRKRIGWGRQLITTPDLCRKCFAIITRLAGALQCKRNQLSLLRESISHRNLYTHLHCDGCSRFISF